MPRVLLIEDDGEIRGLLERFLQRAGFAVTASGDGDSGVKLFTEAPYELVLTDGLLPKKSGFDVAAAIRQQPKGKNVGIVMITAAFKSADAKREALRRGVDAYFTKPFVLGELRDKLLELLDKYGHAPPGPATAPVAPAPAARPPPAAPVLPLGRIDSVRDGARALLACARHRLSGLLELSDAGSVLRIAFLRGVVVGATDNLREHLLGERLWKQGKLTTDQMRVLNARIAKEGERVAEALLALGYVTADEALGFVEEQVNARVRRALLWTGPVRVVEDEAAAQKLASSSVELIDVILAFGLEAAQVPEADRFVAAHKSERLEKAPDFDDLLLALARSKPDASLPGVILAGTPTVAEAAAASTTGEVYASWLAGLVRLPGDPPADARPLPDVMRAELGSALVDRELTAQIAAMLLKARGRTFYELLELTPRASSAEALARLEAIAKDIGPTAAAGRSLGPAVAAARELWAILDDAYRTFSDDDARAMYDAIAAMPEEQPAPAAPSPAASKNTGDEDAFLQGQQALERGDLGPALTLFRAAADNRPSDPEFQSYLGWAQVLNGDASGVARLMTTMREHPQSMRPLFFLGLVAAKDGDTGRARALLEECARRAPLDVEVQTTLRLLS